jgi:hypothetical protein
VKTMKARATIAAVVISVTGCVGGLPSANDLAGASLLPVAAPGRFVVVPPGETGSIGYSGEISEAGLEELQRAYDPSVKTLRIRAEAGTVEAGTRMGSWVHARGLDIVVVDYCVLVCANYVFPAGREKTILPGSLVAWGGDAHKKSIRANSGPGWEKPRSEEDALFTEIGVNECLTRVGDDSALGKATWKHWSGWDGYFTLSPADMARFGVTSVTGAQEEKDVNPAIWKWLHPRFVQVPSDMDVRTACR